MPLDLFGSARTTAVVLIASASFTSPIVVKGDMLADAVGSLRGGSAEVAADTETLVAGGTAFQLPDDWARLGDSQLPSGKHQGGRSVGAVVSGVCPGGRRGAACADGVSVTFIAYDGSKSSSLPLQAELEKQLDRELPRQLRGFKRTSSDARTTADGGRYLSYEFTWRTGAGRSAEVLAAYRYGDGSGVIAVAKGPAAGMAKHEKAVGAFLDSGVEHS